MPPPSKASAKADVAPIPTDGLLHEAAAVVHGESGPKAVAKCGKTSKDKVTRMMSPRAAFVREARRLDPKAEAEERVPAGVCKDCWPGDGIILRAPEKGPGSAEALLRKSRSKPKA